MQAHDKKGDGYSTEHLPIVCVVIPCHNHGDYVIDALYSVKLNTYPNKFVTLVNDGSTDNSSEVIRSYLDDVEDKVDGFVGVTENMPVIVLENESGSGPATARNKAIRHSWEIADIFAMLDADDAYLNSKITDSVAIMLQDPKTIGLVYSDAIIKRMEEDVYLYESRPPFDRRVLERENIISNGPLLNKLALAKVGLYDEKIREPTTEDWDLWLRITEQFIAIHIPEPLQIYRVTGKNATFSVDKTTWNRNYMYVQKKLRQRLASH
jgi:glycosyltransferase involved in cell wall biosynthesis